MKYYLIIEANLAIFNDPSVEKYADLFEFYIFLDLMKKILIMIFILMI